MTQNELVTLKEYVEKLICSMDEKSKLRDVALQDQMDAAAEALEARMELARKNDLEALAARTVNRHTITIIVTGIISAAVGAIVSAMNR